MEYTSISIRAILCGLVLLFLEYCSNNNFVNSYTVNYPRLELRCVAIKFLCNLKDIVRLSYDTDGSK